MHILSGHPIPKKERSLDDIAAYRIKQKPLLDLSAEEVKNPLSGKQEKRVLITCHKNGTKTILLRKEEVEPCVKLYFNKYKGAGVRKLYKAIIKRFSGVSENDVSTVISSLNKAQRLKPSFMNKAPLRPVKSSGVMHHVQVDLVDMKNNAVTVGAQKFKYILVMLDVFSRYIYLRPLTSKSSAEVASVLLKIFSDAGPPRRLQSDQGAEFKGAVAQLMEAMQVDIIHSRPYYPQSQGKVSWHTI